MVAWNSPGSCSEAISYAPTLYVPVLLLTLLGAGTKSAQFPFHFWLPEAMAAPTPVSAYLHGDHGQGGVYLLARLTPVLGGTEAWLYIVTTIGAVTMLVGGSLALYQTDLKRMSPTRPSVPWAR